MSVIGKGVEEGAQAAQEDAQKIEKVGWDEESERGKEEGEGEEEHAPHPRKAWATSEGGSPCGRGVNSLVNGHDASSIVSLLQCNTPGARALPRPSNRPSKELVRSSGVWRAACSVAVVRTSPL